MRAQNYRVIAGSDGTTLLELLVTLSVSALLFVALSGALSFGTRVWEKGIKTDQSTLQAFEAEQLLGHLLDVTRMPNSRQYDEEFQEFSFKGSADSITFVTGPLSYSSRVGLVQAELEIVPVAGGESLVLGWRPIRAAAGGIRQSELAEERPALFGADAIVLSYWGRKSSELTARWHLDWEKEARPPRAVKVVLSNEKQGGRMDRELLLPLRLGHFSPIPDDEAVREGFGG